jgi:hypothetical protein
MSLLLESLGRGQDMITSLAQFGVTRADFERDVLARINSSR